METLISITTQTPEDLLKKLYADNFPWLENYVRQHSGNVADAQDVFQEAISVAWINLREGKFIGNSSQFNAYLRQICKYKWINLMRSGNRNNVIYDDAMLQIEKTQDDVEIEKELLHQTGLLHKSFVKLGIKCKQVLRLYYYKRKSMNEIASGMGNTEDSIKTIKYRCMLQLRKYFLEEMTKNGTI